MAGTNGNTPNGTEWPGNGAEAGSNTQEKRSHSGDAQAGGIEDKVLYLTYGGYNADVLPYHLGC